MKAKKRVGGGKKSGKGRIDTPIDELEEKETIMHYNAVMIEELNSKIQLVLECVQASTKQLDDKIESKVESLRTELLNKIEILRLEFRFKFDRITERCESHDCRLTALEGNS